MFLYCLKWSVVMDVSGWFVMDFCMKFFMAVGVLLGTISSAIGILGIGVV
jgi:hypothetical protein